MISSSSSSIFRYFKYNFDFCFCYPPTTGHTLLFHNSIRLCWVIFNSHLIECPTAAAPLNAFVMEISLGIQEEVEETESESAKEYESAVNNKKVICCGKQQLDFCTAIITTTTAKEVEVVDEMRRRRGEYSDDQLSCSLTSPERGTCVKHTCSYRPIVGFFDVVLLLLLLLSSGEPRKITKSSQR